MSQENVEIVKCGGVAFNAHDLDAWESFFDPDVVFVDHMAAVAEESGAGIAAMRRLVESWIDVFPNFHAETEEYIDAGDRVVTVTEWTGTGSASGLAYHQRAAEVITLRDGKIVRMELGFADRAVALAAAGVAE